MIQRRHTKKIAWFAAVLWPLVLAAPLAHAQDPNPPSIHSTRGAWPITRQWTPAETRHYAKWVNHVYIMKTTGTVEQRMAKIERILTDPEMNLLLHPDFLGQGSNPQLPIAIIRHVNSILDCGKFTAFMPAYYAYRRGLPWMTAYVRSGGGDVRNSPYNVPTGSANSFTSPSLSAFFRNAIGGFSSGNYRVQLNGPNAGLSDSVPVAISREYLMPGCISYMDGHCLLLAHVTKYGELRFMNASTTHTRDIFTYNGMNAVSMNIPEGSSAENGWKRCFQGLRVFRYPIAETNSAGRVIKVRRRTNEEMKEFGFSTEEFEGLQSILDKHYINVNGIKPQSLHDFIRLRMMTVKTIRPLEFMENYTDQLLEAYKLREDFVQQAWQNVKEHGPITYPEEQSNANIFQAHGRWETWSSPSSDVDRRNMYFYLSEWMDYALRCFGMMPSFVDLTGLEKYHIRTQADLARALIKEKNRLFDEKYMYYTNSKGDKVKLTLSDIEKRLYDLSFDPNHPPELRWGAPIGSAERATAPQTYTPVPDGKHIPMEKAYTLETYYRTVGERETEMSCLRGMFTEGFPIRKKFDEYMKLWFYYDKPTDALQAWLNETGRGQPAKAKAPTLSHDFASSTPY